MIDEDSIVAFHQPVLVKKDKRVVVIKGLARLKSLKDDKDTVVFIGTVGEKLDKPIEG